MTTHRRGSCSPSPDEPSAWPPGADQPVTVADYHTAGEPFRIVTGGVAPLHGSDVPARRAHAAAHHDHVRRLLVHEPRGHADMYGGFVTPPDDTDGDLGVVFFHNEGYSTACGHGTIALVTWALDEGVVARTGTETTVVVDAPSGRLTCVATSVGDRVTEVRFTNVAAFAAVLDLEVQPATMPGATVRVDLGFGGAFYAIVEAADVGCAVVPGDLDRLIAHGRAIKAAVEDDREVVHPGSGHLRDVYGVVFVDGTRTREGAAGQRLHQRNVAVFADGQVDRSPTGSGVSARLAVLDARGLLPRGHTLVTTGIAGQAFTGRVVADADLPGQPAVLTEVAGSAHRTGTAAFTLDPHDPLGTGFVLR